MKHYEVNFVDRTVETVGAEELPPNITHPMYNVSNESPGQGYQLKAVPFDKWWAVTLLRLDTTQVKLVPNGRIHINIDNVTFIKEA